MIENFTSEKGRVHYLTKNSLIDLHELLSKNVHLLDGMDPVEPPGVKNIGMLESAVGRQTTGSGDFYKYPDCFSNAATLVYGVIKNHAFHNGNKRAGLLALIKHLYVNGYVLSPYLDAQELYEFLIAIADSKLKEFNYKHKKKYRFILSKKIRKANDDWDDDTKVRFIALWIKKNSSPKSSTIKGDVKISTLKKVLENKNIKLNQNGSGLEVYIEKENKFLGIGIGTKKQNVKTYSLGNNRSSISKGTLKVLRRDFNLNKVNGIDDTFFYDDDAFLDFEIKTYKQLIYRLSKT